MNNIGKGKVNSRVRAYKRITLNCVEMFNWFVNSLRPRQGYRIEVFCGVINPDGIYISPMKNLSVPPAAIEFNNRIGIANFNISTMSGVVHHYNQEIEAFVCSIPVNSLITKIIIPPILMMRVQANGDSGHVVPISPYQCSDLYSDKNGILTPRCIYTHSCISTNEVVSKNVVSLTDMRRIKQGNPDNR